LFAISVRVIWPKLTLGRQLCILLALLLTNHVVLLLTYAGISGAPEYLQDGVTQNCLLMQLWFKLLVGILGFSGLEIWVRNRVGRPAEPCAAPNCGPATHLGSSGVTEGPPSVS
jgi:hypothetical protein